MNHNARKVIKDVKDIVWDMPYGSHLHLNQDVQDDLEAIRVRLNWLLSKENLLNQSLKEKVKE